MSGHSKWSTIKHQKAATDKKRGKIFSKMAKAISIAAKEGASGDPEVNARLRLAIDQAKAVNMPKDNIKRAIDRGLGRGEGVELRTVLYEGFGPGKVAVMVDCITDNKNRTAAEIKSCFEKEQGGLGAPGSAAYLFEKKGLILVKKQADLEGQMLKLMDLGVDDIEENDLLLEVYTVQDQLEAVKQKITALGFLMAEASLIFKPKTLITIESLEKQKKLLALLEKLEDFDDVQRVYCNADFVAKDTDD